MMPTKNASSDMKSAARPRNETTRLSALAIGLRLMITAAPKTSMRAEAIQKKTGDIINFGFRISEFGSRFSFFLVPFQDESMHYAPDLEQLLLVVHHLRAGEAGDRVILAQKDRLLRA